MRSSGVPGVISGGWPAENVEPLVDGAARLCAALDAPLAMIHARDGPSFEQRKAAHRSAAEAVHGRAVYPWGPKWGLSGVAYRTVLGRPFVDLIGETALAESPSTVAERRGALWVLKGAADPTAWTGDRWTPEEREIAQRLGEDLFFNPTSGALPTRTPEIADFPSFPVYVLDAEKTLISVPPESLPPPPRPPERKRPAVMEDEWTGPSPDLTPQDFRTMASTASRHVGRLVPNFWSDSPLYWVEEFLRGRAHEGDFDRYMGNFGAWLGEFMRDYLDCDWERIEGAPVGWLIRSRDGEKRDPFEMVRRIRKAGRDAVLTPMIQAMSPELDLRDPDGRQEAGTAEVKDR